MPVPDTGHASVDGGRRNVVVLLVPQDVARPVSAHRRDAAVVPVGVPRLRREPKDTGVTVIGKEDAPGRGRRREDVEVDAVATVLTGPPTKDAVSLEGLLVAQDTEVAEVVGLPLLTDPLRLSEEVDEKGGVAPHVHNVATEDADVFGPETDVASLLVQPTGRHVTRLRMGVGGVDMKLFVPPVSSGVLRKGKEVFN